MSSGGTLVRLRVGYWRALRSFLLKERRDVWKRMGVIKSELDRIGIVKVEYAQDREDGQDWESGRRTEKRVNIYCSPPGCSLEKLMQAYVAIGGNPFDISPFWLPDKRVIADPRSHNPDNPVKHFDEYPYGGVVAPLSKEVADTVGDDERKRDSGEGSTNFGEHTGGYLNCIKYPPRRLGDRVNSTFNTEHTAIAATISRVRKFADQEMKYKRQELEHRIIKLMDLREQLDNEVDEILYSSFGGALPELDGPDHWDSKLFSPGMRVQAIIRDIDAILFYYQEEDGSVVMHADSIELGKYNWTYDDDEDGQEDVLDLMW